MLTLRPIKLGSPVYAHLADYEVKDDGQSIGRIMEQRRPPSKPRYARGIPETWWYDHEKTAKT